MATLFVATFSSDPENDTVEGFEFAHIQITKELCDVVESRRALFLLSVAKDQDVAQMDFRDMTPAFFSDPCPDVDDLEGESGIYIAKGDQEKDLLKIGHSPVSYGRMQLTDLGVTWMVSPKHLNVEVSTMEIPYSYFKI